MALDSIRPMLASVVVGDQTLWMGRQAATAPLTAEATHLLPPFDEYLVGYTYRSAALETKPAPKVVASKNGMFYPIIVYRGQVVGTWRRIFKKDTVLLSAHFLTTPPPLPELHKAAQRYADFVQKKIQIEII